MASSPTIRSGGHGERNAIVEVAWWAWVAVVAAILVIGEGDVIGPLRMDGGSAGGRPFEGVEREAIDLEKTT